MKRLSCSISAHFALSDLRESSSLDQIPFDQQLDQLTMNRLPSTLRSLARTQLRRPFSTSITPYSSESDLTHPSLLKDPPATMPSTSTDPWSLQPPPPPSANADGSDLSMAELIVSPHPEGRDGERTEVLRKRLVYESRKRGILETDLILGTFARTRLAGMSDRELREYDRVRLFVLVVGADRQDVGRS